MAIGDRVGEAMQNIVSASDFEFCQGVSQDIVVVLPSAKDREKQVNASAAECNKQLSIVHTEGLQPMVMHDEHSGLSTMQNAGNGEVVTCKYQGCSKPSQGNTMHFEAPTGGSEGCMVQGCTKGALEDTPLCISHHSMLRKVCCAITGCTNIACTSSGGLTDCCVKHGGGKRCKYDSCGKGAQGKTDFCVDMVGKDGASLKDAGRLLKGRQVFALHMAGEGDASLKDVGRVRKGKMITVPNMVERDTIRCVNLSMVVASVLKGEQIFALPMVGEGDAS
ncbi:hypothetical protein BRADI_4g10940v3 [Brachypodium distachyon]|uniref:Uncharacterized protein n=1 Tax=Brachypodium distachyon TaxID=15368 RepID=A0A0Q3PDT6_BRADI|nr:hypothetical protein BRADI_4g10940v3 [Brachypodium distachyon]PNT63051.1 hypothetical protein BRADI_4g10940v3 [Brachypodium distachyon]PNT63052.1 hypothetical protein BRADI_4g10940v3 [Brachypodium distachyon]PNT63053.1 hypothetical protein BRADI_4g10940v3 [Brachypodium distachyon]PNT63054.1 hypothetical protein BRADI_4g10940v3 [Brachypodium distachyon]